AVEAVETALTPNPGDPGQTRQRLERDRGAHRYADEDKWLVGGASAEVRRGGEDVFHIPAAERRGGAGAVAVAAEGEASDGGAQPVQGRQEAGQVALVAAVAVAEQDVAPGLGVRHEPGR